MFARFCDTSNIDFAFITYNYLPSSIEELRWKNLSVSTQLEQIQKKKAELKNELQSMEHKERGLGESIKVLEEKMMIHDLEERVKAKRAIVERLEFRKRDLEKRLKEPQKKPDPSQMPHRPTPAPQAADKAEEPQRREPMEVTVSAAPAGNQHPKQSAAPAGPQQPKKPEEKKEKQEEKKKRKWF